MEVQSGPGMLEIQTFSPLENSPLKEALNETKVVVSDIDYTLMNFGNGHSAGIQELGHRFGGEFASQVDEMFNLILGGNRFKEGQFWDNREIYNRVLKQIEEFQPEIVRQWGGVRQWSRETWMMIAASNLDLELSQEDIIGGRDAYWQALGKGSTIYPDAQQLVTALKDKGVPLFLMTGSDSVLVGRDNQWYYEPEQAKEYKRQRITNLPFSFVDAEIGDPIDKPDPRFFDALLAKIRNHGEYVKDDLLFIGDSPRNDLETPQQMGFRTLHIKR